MSTVQPLHFVPSMAVEERARADLYALLARLFYAGPDSALLADIAAAEGLVAPSDSALSRAWSALREASAAGQAAQARQEYDDIFVGAGRAPVSIYAAHYLTENWKDHTLVNLRGELDRLGLARQPGAVEPEDHLAGLLDVMRHLILRAQDGDIALQEGFFRSYLAPWYAKFVATVQADANAAYYRHVSALLCAFLDIEVECFQIA